MAKSVVTNNENSLLYMPNELMRFIRRDTYSLLIKGFAGTGKTTLALTILRALESKNNFFYISTRISPKQLFQYYPWLAEFIEQPKTSSSEMTEHKLTPSFEDARLDEPESLFERITNQLMDIKSPIIIIDSWDAIASFMDKEARLNNERVLQTWRERANAKLIFISEHPDDTTLDFLVDGIVELKQSYYNNVKIREIFLLKLRGVRIERSSYIYTLDNSIFKSFVPYKPIKLRSSAPKHVESGNIGTDEYFSSGYASLDGSIGGGFPKKGLVLLELHSHVNPVVGMVFLEKIISNFAAAGHWILFHPFGLMDPQTILNYLTTSIPGGKKDRLKILWMDKASGNSHNIILPNKKQQDPFLAAISKIEQKKSGKLLLNIIGTDVMYRHYGKDLINGIENVISRSRVSADLTIAIVSHLQKDVLQYLTGISDVHLHFLMLNDTLFLKSLVPASPLFSVVLEENKVDFEPIV